MLDWKPAAVLFVFYDQKAYRSYPLGFGDRCPDHYGFAIGYAQLEKAPVLL